MISADDPVSFERTLNTLSTESQFILLSSIESTIVEHVHRPRVFIRKVITDSSDKNGAFVFKVQSSDIISDRLTIRDLELYHTPSAAIAAAFYLLHEKVRSAAKYSKRGGHPFWLM